VVGPAPRARAALAVLLLATAAARSGADATVAVKLRILESLARVAEKEWTLYSMGAARVSLGVTSENVKADLAVSALLGEGMEDFVPSLTRASVAARLPGLRVTLGKARLSWGEGVAFNAADLLFGGSSVGALDLTAETLRDDAAWMAALYLPLGSFSFLEAVALPPPLDVAALVANPASSLPDPADAAAGARFVGKLWGVKTEASYLYRGSTRTHAVAACLQGNLIVDWHLSAAAELGADSLNAEEVAGSLRVSGGIFHLQRLGPRASLSMRLEALAAPWGEWEEIEPPGAPAAYGILLYPEIGLSVGQELSLTARALISPVDGSALLVPALSLTLWKGLSFLGMASIAVGDETDTWSWERSGSIALLVGCALSY
jgi:hypothetical protein